MREEYRVRRTNSYRSLASVYEVTRPIERAKDLPNGEEIATGYLGEGGSLSTGTDYGGRVWAGSLGREEENES